VAVFSVMYAIGSAAGPLLGGALVAVWGWPAVFWFRAPIALAALLCLEGLPAIARSAVREPLDIAGAVLLALAISTVLLMVNQLQYLDHRALLPVALAATGIASLVGFVHWESRVAQPIVNPGWFKIGGFTAVNSASVLVYLTSFSVLLFGPYYLQRFEALPVATAGGVLGASFLGSIIASPLAGSLIERIPAARVAAFGAALAGAALVLIACNNPGASWQIVAIIAVLIIQGFGVGLFQVAYMDVVMRTLPRYQRGVAGSIAMLTRSLGVVTGATLLTLIFHAVETVGLAQAQAPSDSFLGAFRATFCLAGLASAMAGLPVLASQRRG
jgi:MFS family permease